MSKGMWLKIICNRFLFNLKTKKMKYLKICKSLFTVLILLILFNCKKEALKTAPIVSVTNASNITANSASSGGNVSADGGDAVTSRGVCWSIGSNPSTSDNKTSDGSGIGSFSSSITGLNPGVTYTLKAYATNSVGTSYSSSTSFTTISVGATLTTVAAISITSNSASSGGNITSDGGSSVTGRGVCWATTAGPTVSGSKSSDGTGIGNYTSSISGLTPGTVYYVRAYATNSAGTSYGPEISFTSSFVSPSLTTQIISAVTTTTANSGGNISSAGGGTITARGVCWSTSTGPTINNIKTSDGTGIGNFVSSLTGLTAATTYYVRAYATNSAGTAYGNEIVFSTAANLPTLTTATFSALSYATVTSGGNISSDGGGTITSRGVCWSTTNNPTISDNKTSDGTGPGIFTSSVSGLSGTTAYYLRAYATNSAGTAYGNQIIFTTTVAPPTVTDIDGNVYNMITIGPQVWMQENLKTKRYNDGTSIPNVTGNSAWVGLTTPGYCWYNNDEATYKNTYGALYNFYTVQTGKLCPTGWDVPSKDDWTVLITFLGGANNPSIARNKLMETGTIHWKSNSTGTNSSGFTATPGGYRSMEKIINEGAFSQIGTNANWWTSTIIDKLYSPQVVYYIELTNTFDMVREGFTSSSYNQRNMGLSVRCIKK
jgi:uncharacterized protein (TIGR02145 family)